MKTGLDARREYDRSVLTEERAGMDPHGFFREWLVEAEDAGEPDHNAMMLSTCGPDHVSCRVVLLREADASGFTFFTNYNSRKAMELEADPRAALTFFWPGLERQVRIQGHAERISAAESDAYFRSRPRASRVGAWASDQSMEIGDRAALEEKVARWNERLHDSEVPRPGHWGGFRVVPVSIEFWQGRPDRMHDRLLFRRKDDGGWTRSRLQP
ncbi:MAG TPA: pyridoxamine 5'-phosphate oxidase [Flavobacteriales bacterium]|nr:pyridoxamine 5'-phosphate oxidase [Flavobacteriales bacterium]HPF66696.1 pyridoxamine 5'-phosphate oxidase [Flavobacteriales bacterium]HRW88630.1 pyridoxamine 5'-phosphate oxidase [Flavobacteriales bacterium]